MKIFVINLARRSDRKLFMKKQLDELGLEAEFIEAVDGKNFTNFETISYDKTQAIKRNGDSLNPGELGCALSHRAVYEKIVQENISEALILEDDVQLSVHLGRLLTDTELLQSIKWNWLQIDYPLITILDWIKSSWWHIRKNPFFILYVVLKFPYIITLSVFERVRNKTTNPKNPKIVYMPRPLYFASCYIVNNAGAKILLDMATPVVYTADRLPNQARIKVKDFRMRAIVPRIAQQKLGVFSSDIGHA